jgi:hypothetical protein
LFFMAGTIQGVLQGAAGISDQKQKIDHYKMLLSSIIATNNVQHAKDFIDHSKFSFFFRCLILGWCVLFSFVMCVLSDPYLYYAPNSEPDVPKKVGCSFSFPHAVCSISSDVFSEECFLSSSCGAFSLKTLITAVGLYQVPVSVFTAKVLGHCIISLLVLLPMI